jgi:hypothetical protein
MNARDVFYHALILLWISKSNISSLGSALDHKNSFVWLEESKDIFMHHDAVFFCFYQQKIRY